jgi:ABC-type nitrate/sulfonate/bicarbonate transport system substrate-binding protein
MSTGRRHLVPLAAVLVALLALACSSGAAGTGRAPAPPPAPAAPAGADATSAPPLLQSRSAYTTISTTSAAWWIAQDGGYFREQGLDVELAHVDAGATLLAAMRNGELDVSGGGGPSIVLGNLQGLETVLIGCTVGTLEGSVFVRPELRTVDDLRGKTIGVNRLKAITDVGARLAFQRAGLVPDVDIFTRGTGGQAEALAALEAGTVDGISVNVPTAFEVQKRGYREAFNVGQMQIGFITGGISSTRTKLRERPELPERYLRAMAQAMSRFKTDREFAIQVVGKYTQMDDRDVLGPTVDYYVPLFTVDPYPEPAAVQAVLDAEENPAARTARPEDVVDYRYADRLRQSGFLATLPR